MKQFNVISGLPRSGSTLLCNILNMNPKFYATATSPTLDMLIAHQSCFSHNQAFKASDRLNTYNNFAQAQKAFLETYYNISEKEVIFDKNRGWPLHLMKLDDIFDNEDTKVIWTYRNPIHILCSLEARHRQIPLIQYQEEGVNPGMYSTLGKRIDNWINDNGIVAFPAWALNDAVEMGYKDRIYFVDYKELCINTQDVMDKIHGFLGLELYNYAEKQFKDLRQTTYESDSFYNHKYPHDIKEGEIKYKKPTIDLPSQYEKHINERFSWLNEFILKNLKTNNRMSYKLVEN